jgi:hypothetical protein
VTLLGEETGFLGMLRGHKVSFKAPGSQGIVYGEIVAAMPAAMAVETEIQDPGCLFEPGTRVSGVVVLLDSRAHFEATVAMIEGNTVLMHDLSDFRIEGGCRMFRRKCDLVASYRLVWPSPERQPDRNRIMGQAPPKSARCVDVSVGGVALEIPEPAYSGDKFLVEINLPGSDAPVTVVAEVMWSEDGISDPETPRKAGLKLIESSRADAAKIKAFVNCPDQAQRKTSEPSLLLNQASDYISEPYEPEEKTTPIELASDLLIT